MPPRPDEHPVQNGAAASLYVNYFEVAHNRYEFLLELGQYRPGRDDGAGTLAIHTRLAVSPPYAKMLAELLGRAVGEHEKGHGPIAALSDTATPFDVVLHSLPDFEDRARELRARPRPDEESPDGSDGAPQPGPGKER